MRLPVISASHQPSRDDLVRLYHRTQLHWTRHLGEEASLDVGTAIVNASLRDVSDANCVLDAAVPEGASAEQAVSEVDEHFAQLQTRCTTWAMNPAALADRTEPLKTYLLTQGFSKRSHDILHVAGMSYAPLAETPGLIIIPARASFRHARQLADEWAREQSVPQLAEAAMLHLDDPHVDALLAIKDGAAVASIAVLAVGDIGSVRNLFVAQAFRRQHIAQTMMNRAMEICARSVFKHLFVGVEEADIHRSLFGRWGFTPIGSHTSYVRPPARKSSPA